MKEKYYILEKHYGNHSKVAKALGMSARNYRNIRNEHHPPSQVIKNLIDEMVKTILNKPSIR